MFLIAADGVVDLGIWSNEVAAFLVFPVVSYVVLCSWALIFTCQITLENARENHPVTEAVPPLLCKEGSRLSNLMLSTLKITLLLVICASACTSRQVYVTSASTAPASINTININTASA